MHNYNDSRKVTKENAKIFKALITLNNTQRPFFFKKSGEPKNPPARKKHRRKERFFHFSSFEGGCLDTEDRF